MKWLGIAALCLLFIPSAPAADTTGTVRVSTGVLSLSANPANRIMPPAEPGESFTSFTLDPGVRVTLQHPVGIGEATTTGAEGSANLNKSIHVMLYLLPNGNTTEQALGRSQSEGLDWHYGIQHIAAQTRRVRQLLAPRTVVTAVVEADTLSWPTWRRITPDPDSRITGIVEAVLQQAIRTTYGSSDTSATFDLIAHSGGGSFIFGYINANSSIPENLQHIAFIDANYSFSHEDGHGLKLRTWLESSPKHRLIVLAYDDRLVTLNGKPIVSDTGGTWRATDRMAASFQDTVAYKTGRLNDLETSSAYSGRLMLARHPNPQKKILHTVLVEKNGFVYSAVLGRSDSQKNDEPFAESESYRELILP